MRYPTTRNVVLIAIVAFLATGTSGCLFFGHAQKAPLAGTKAAPDKVLYTQALNNIKHGHYTVGRLLLQNLINTYPESEYLAKAKLEVANSYYKQGGVEALTEAVAEYKDFITFFPFLHEAAFAQYRAAMAHFRMMEKPDRDPTQALEAEAELQTMILKYPHSQWTTQARQRLREVQEVLAQGQFEVASFYYERKAYPASAARLLNLTERYPLFSQADEANMMLGQIYQKFEHKDFAARFYDNIVRDYPLSKLAPEAKKNLVAMGYRVPKPDPKALARMEKEEKFDKDKPGILGETMDVLRTGPDVAITHAAHFGQPNLTPDVSSVWAHQVLEPSVISLAANSPSEEIDHSISVTPVISGGPQISGSGSEVTAGASGAATGNSVEAGPVEGGGEATAPAGSKTSTANDPSKTEAAKPDATATGKGKKAAPKAANGKEKKKKKKKGLLHKIIPF
jgi:outer membrane protein assembly factor BamD